MNVNYIIFWLRSTRQPQCYPRFPCAFLGDALCYWHHPRESTSAPVGPADIIESRFVITAIHFHFLMAQRQHFRKVIPMKHHRAPEYPENGYVSSLSFLLDFKGWCTSMGWCFQSHKYLHLRLAEFRGVQTSLTRWMWKLPDEMSLDALVPPLYVNIFNKTAALWHQLLASSCGRPTGWREKKEMCGWWPKVRCDPQQGVSGCYGSLIVQLPSFFLS